MFASGINRNTEGRPVTYWVEHDTRRGSLHRFGAYAC